MSLMNMAPNGSSNPYMYREQRRKLHKNLYVHRHSRPWTAPDQSGKNGEQGNTELGMRTTVAGRALNFEIAGEREGGQATQHRTESETTAQTMEAMEADAPTAQPSSYTAPTKRGG